MSQPVMDAIDVTAQKFHRTKDPQHFTDFVKLATPIIRQVAYKACRDSTWNVDDLFAILLADMWRLFNRWEPVPGKKFHWLMLRQLKNKTINFIQHQRGHPHQICNVCNTKQVSKASAECTTCGSSLKLPNLSFSLDLALSLGLPLSTHQPDYLRDIENKQIVSRLLQRVKTIDMTTYTILQLMLQGCSKSEISREVKLAQNAMNNRIKKCRQIVEDLI